MTFKSHRPSSNAATPFHPSVLGRPRGTKSRLRGSRKRPWRGYTKNRSPVCPLLDTRLGICCKIDQELPVDFIDRATYCVAFFWIYQVVAHACRNLFRAAPKERFRDPRRRVLVPWRAAKARSASCGAGLPAKAEAIRQPMSCNLECESAFKRRRDTPQPIAPARFAARPSFRGRA